MCAPSAGVIDSQSVKIAESGGPWRYDPSEKTTGRKRHIRTDTDGNLVHAIVHTAGIQGRDGAPLVLAENFEQAIASATAWLFIASIQLLARRTVRAISSRRMILNQTPSRHVLRKAYDLFHPSPDRDSVA